MAAIRSLALLGTGIVFGSLACGGGGDGDVLGPPPPAGFDATGDWTYTERLTDPAHGLRCNDHGVLHIVQTGSTLGGTLFQNVSCTGPGGTASDTATGAISSGTIVGAAISLTVDVCQYTGALYTSGADVKAKGDASCTIDLGGGTVVHLNGTWQGAYAGDLSPPTARGTAIGTLGDTLQVPGDTLSVTVSGSDNLALSWVGFSLGPPANFRDSVPVAGRAAAGTLRTTVPRAWIGMSRFLVFARDSAGRLGDDPDEANRPPRFVSVGDFIRPPTSEIAIGGHSSVRQMLEDPVRDLLYLSQPELSRVARYSLTSRSVATPISLSSAPYGLDLTLGGDSLLVALRDADALAVVNLQPATPTVNTLPLQFAPFEGGPDQIRVAANNHVLISLTGLPICVGCGRLMELNLLNGNQRVRDDVGFFSQIAEIAPLISGTARSPVIAYTGLGCPCSAQLYLTATDSFSTSRAAGDLVWPPPTIDTDGTRVLVGPKLFDGTLTPLQTLAPSGQYYWGVSALSPDGQTAAFATDEGFMLLRISDGVVLGRYRLPVLPAQLQFLSSARLLLAWGGYSFGTGTNRVFLVELP